MTTVRHVSVLVVLGIGALVTSGVACSDDVTSGDLRSADAGGATSREASTGGPIVTPCPLALDFQEADVDAKLKATWKGPTLQPAACTGAELTTFGATLAASSAKTTIEELAVGLGARCTACLFSTTVDDHWQIIVALAGGEPTEGFINFGACIAAETNEACGRAFQYNQFCADAACAQCSENGTQACYEAVWAKGGACEGALSTMKSACAGLDDAMRTCTNETVGNARVLCGARTDADGGVDASSDAADAGDASSDAGDADSSM